MTLAIVRDDRTDDLSRDVRALEVAAKDAREVLGGVVIAQRDLTSAVQTLTAEVRQLGAGQADVQAAIIRGEVRAARAEKRIAAIKGAGAGGGVVSVLAFVVYVIERLLG